MKRTMKFQQIQAGRNLFLAIAVLFSTGLLSSQLFAAGPDFSGKWTLNEEKSEIGEMRFGASAALEVKQDKSNLTVVRVRTGRDGQEMRMEMKYSLDGKETTSGEGNRSAVTTAKWSEDGKSLMIHTKRSFTRDGQTMEFETDETWMLSSDGKSLTIQSSSSSPRGDRSMKLVYNLG